MLLGHEGNVNGLSVEVGSHFGRFSHVATVHKPEAGRNGGCERNAIIDEGQRCRAGDVFPLGS